MSGSARRLIQDRGTPVQVIDIYREFSSDGLNGPTYINHYFARQQTNAVLNRAGDFTREFVTSVGDIDTQTIMAFFAEADRSGEPVIRDVQTDVPTDEQIPGGANQSKDQYGPTILRDLENDEDFNVVNIVQEQTGVRRVQANLRDEPFDLENRPARFGDGSSFY